VLDDCTINLGQGIPGRSNELPTSPTEFPCHVGFGFEIRDAPKVLDRACLTELTELPDDHLISIDTDGIFRCRLLFNLGEEV
jgi:hypothetical protein